MHSVRQGTVKEAQASAKSFLSQLLGIDFDQNKHAQAAPSAPEAQQQEAVQAKQNGGEIFNIVNHQPSSEKQKIFADKAPRPRIEAAIDYHRDVVKNREKLSKQDHREMQRNIEQIKVEISKLVASSQVLKMEFASVNVEQSTANVGQYHLNFLEWMLTVIRSARQKVEDSQSWVGAIKGKGAKKNYWGMLKKHGTTFGLSGERSVATQVG